MTFLTIDAHRLSGEVIEQYKKDYGVTLVDIGEQPWKVVFRGERDKLIKMLDENWSLEPNDLNDPEYQADLFSEDYSLFTKEFPDFVLDVCIPKGFEDTSWHNDTMPSWGKKLPDGNFLRLWIDYPKVEDRECGGGTRFCVQLANEEYEFIKDLLLTDDYSEVATMINGLDKQNKSKLAH